ncbi:PTS sugar transporter subunit IIA [Bacillus sp. CECT 9360]|uniref:PTS sugar transporter subunit IIA n=1 Tax=Bacillus sp. CECT 9360 TaxID=2845821 RepID=UPI0025B70672|nr:PTS sugar transporter subunit IIA [Bacillus sp. CECT 9360]
MNQLYPSYYRNPKGIQSVTPKLIFMIADPTDSEGNEHLKILQMLSRRLMDESYRERLLSVSSKKKHYNY